MENGICQIRCRDLELKGNNRSQGQAAEGCWNETELRCTLSSCARMCLSFCLGYILSRWTKSLSPVPSTNGMSCLATTGEMSEALCDVEALIDTPSVYGVPD